MKYLKLQNETIKRMFNNESSLNWEEYSRNIGGYEEKYLAIYAKGNSAIFFIPESLDFINSNKFESTPRNLCGKMISEIEANGEQLTPTNQTFALTRGTVRKFVCDDFATYFDTKLLDYLEMYEHDLSFECCNRFSPMLVKENSTILAIILPVKFEEEE